MAGMEKIGEAILDKVRAEADAIIKDAEKKAAEEIEQAKKEQVARLEAEKAKMLQQAHEEATRTAAQAQVKARQELSQAKADVVNEMLSQVKKELAGTTTSQGLLTSLIKEAMSPLGVSQERLYVSSKDLAAARKLVEKDKELTGRITEVKEHSNLGGVIIEDMGGRVRIDNTYETRLEMLLPRLLPEVGKELFGG